MIQIKKNRVLVMMSDEDVSRCTIEAESMHMTRAAYIRHIIYREWEREDRQREAREARENMLSRGGGQDEPVDE